MDIYDKVIERLGMFGVQALAAPDPAVTFAIGRAEEQLLADINHSEMPEGLKYTFIDLAVGYYLHDAKATGRLQADEIDLAAVPAKQIKEGDVQITLASAADGSLTPEQRLDSLIHTLLHPPASVLSHYRRIVW